MSKHLSYDDRIMIESMLNNDKTIIQIARELKRDASGIRREIKNHRIETLPVKFNGGVGNRCANRATCTLYRLCSTTCNSPCRFCSKCNVSCAAFVLDLCERLKKDSFVCNGCSLRCSNTRTKFHYRANSANQHYKNILSDRRMGTDTSPEELKRIAMIVAPLIRQGQSIKQIFMKHKRDLGISERTLYNYINDKLIESVMNLDLLRKVKFKIRRKYIPRQINRQCRINRTYQDFLTFITCNNYSIIEMDCVEGKKGEPLLMTLLLRNCHFLLAYKIDSQTSAEIV